MSWLAPSRSRRSGRPSNLGGLQNDIQSNPQAGVVGFEVLPFLVLVFMVGALMFAQSWAVLDAKMATTSAARQATRTFVEQPGRSSVAGARSQAVKAGTAALTANKLVGESAVAPAGTLSLQRCARVTFEATHRVPALRLPLLTNADPIFVRSQHSEVVDPFRSGLTGRANCVR